MEDPYGVQGKITVNNPNVNSVRSSSKDGINPNSILNPMDPAYQHRPKAAVAPSRGTHIETNSQC